MHAQALIAGAAIGVIAAPGAARFAEHQDALAIVLESGGLGKIGRAGARFHRQAFAFAHHAARPASDFRQLLGAEAMHDLVERARHGRQRGQFLDHAVASFHGLAALDGLAIAPDRPRREIALIVRELFEQLGGEGVGEIVQHILARGEVHGEIVPFAGGNLRQPALHQRLAGGDHLHDGGMAVGQVAVNGFDQGRRHHAGEQMTEEALLGGLEGRARRRLGLGIEGLGALFAGAGDVGGIQRGREIVVNDLEGAGIGVIDAPLLRGEFVLQQIVFDAGEGERAGGVETQALKVARHHFHRRHAAGLDRFDECRPTRKGKIVAAPQPQALGIGEIAHRGGAGGRDVQHAGVSQRVLQAQARPALLRGATSPRSPLPPAALAMAWASSNTMTPSKSRPSQSRICWSRETFSSRSAERSVA